jgi:LacI family transcriptional regulator
MARGPTSTGRTTIRDVASRAGVSVATVSRVLSGDYPVAAGTRTRVMRAVRDLDYVVNAHARALAGMSPQTVAIIVDSVTAPFHAHIAQGVEEQAAVEGRLCLVCTTQGDPDRELAVVNLMREQHADAVILVGAVVENDVYRARMVRFAAALDAVGSRLVLCGRPPLGPDVPATVVEYDNTAGAYAITSHLLSAGHRRILYLGGAVGHTTGEARVAGYRQALRDHGLEPDPRLESFGRFSRAFGYRGLKEILDRDAGGDTCDFTAVFAADDLVAAGALQALREAGRQVPADVSIVGYDDIPLAADLNPPLTTVHIPHEELGRTAVRLALHRGERGPQHLVVGTHVVVRESVAPLRDAGAS